MKEVVSIAIMVPIGIDLWASLRSPDLLEPAIIPEIKHNTHTHARTCTHGKNDPVQKVIPGGAHQISQILSAYLFSMILDSVLCHLPVTEGKYIPTSRVK